MKDWEKLKEDLVERYNKNYYDTLRGTPPELLAIFEEPKSPAKDIASEEELASYLDSFFFPLIEKGNLTQDLIDKYLTLFDRHGLPINIGEYLASVDERKKIREETSDITDQQEIRRRWRQQLGDRLRGMRRVRELTIRQASELSGVDKNIISRIEAGRANATIDSIFALIEAYKADMIIDPGKREIR